jgi:crotonobetainyl-CoA:carnitine CoA-transferase CaiB-like acyl-CoA transferase
MLTTMLSTATHALSEDMVRYEGRGPAPTADPELRGLSALYRLYQAQDGWVFLAAPGPRDWTRLMKALPDRAETLGDPRFGSPEARSANDSVLVAILSEVFAQRPAAEWEKSLRAAEVACVEVAPGPVEGGYLDEGSVGRLSGFVTRCEHPFLGEVERLAPMVRFSRSTTVAGGSCAVGQQSLTILRELGYAEDRIDELTGSGVVVTS